VKKGQTNFFKANRLNIRPKKARRPTKIFKANQLETRSNFRNLA